MDLKDVPEFYEVELGESLISRTESLGEFKRQQSRARICARPRGVNAGREGADQRSHTTSAPLEWLA